MERPTAVTVIGWLAICFGILGCFGGLMGLCFSLVLPMPHADELSRNQDGIAMPFRIMIHIFDYFPLVAALQLVISAIAIASGVFFLRLKAWARRVLEILSWLFLTYDLGFGVFWIWALLSMNHQMSNGSHGAAWIFLMFIIFGVGMIIAFAVPPVAIIRFLRSSRIRSAARL